MPAVILTFVKSEIKRSSNLSEPIPNLLIPNCEIDLIPQVSYPREFFQQNEADLSNFWIARRNANIEQILTRFKKDSILEIGSGHGAVAKYLARAGFDVFCVEPQIEGASQTAEAGIVTLVSTNPTDHILEQSQAAIGIFDVLEHIESESKFLTMIASLLSRDGILILTVPAGNWLYSQTDIALGHYRRYSRRHLRKLLDSAGFEEVHSRYLFLFLVPLAFLFRTLPFRLNIQRSNNEQLKRVGDALSSESHASRLLGVISRLEGRLDRSGLLPYGLTQLAVYRLKNVSDVGITST
jgi:hypothetical protein